MGQADLETDVCQIAGLSTVVARDPQFGAAKNTMGKP